MRQLFCWHESSFKKNSAVQINLVDVPGRVELGKGGVGLERATSHLKNILWVFPLQSVIDEF
jgi:hypothetical protein